MLHSYHVGRLAVSCAACLALAVNTSIADGAVQCGFEDYIKQNSWFTVRVESLDPSARVRVEVKDPRRAYWDDTDRQRQSPTFTGMPGSPTVSCRITEHGEGALLHCDWTDAKGSARSATLLPKVVPSQELLVLIIGDQPAAFEFIASVRLPDGKGCRMARCSPGMFPEHWRDLDSLDAVILDSTEDTPFSEKHQAALRNWAACGGTVIITPGAFTSSSGPDTWALFEEAETAPAANVEGGALKHLLSDFAEHLGAVPTVGLRVPRRFNLLGSDEEAFVAAKDFGLGRVIAIGLDWDRVQIGERIAFETFRRRLWAKVLTLVREEGHGRMNTIAVTPKEAKARYLAWYVMAFLVAYALVLGLGNWLVLRGIARLEYGIITLPVGAILFAAAAFCVGLALRGDETLVREMELTLGVDTRTAVSQGMTGILCGDRGSFSLTASDPLALIQASDPDHYWHSFGMSGQDVKHYAFTPSMSIAAGKIGMWTMAYVQTRRAPDLGGGLATTSTLIGTNLAISIESKLPFVLRDAHAFYRWHRLAIGDVAPGEEHDVCIELIGLDQLARSRCPNCGGFHRGWYSEEFAEKYPLQEDLRLALEQTHGSLISAKAFIAGWRDRDEPLVCVDRELSRHEQRELCVFPLHVELGKQPASLPLGLTDSWHLAPWFHRESLAAHGLSWQHGPVLRDALGIETKEPGASYTGSERIEGTGRILAFPLPAMRHDSKATGIELRWGQETSRRWQATTSVCLSAYDWQRGEWVDLHTGREGTRVIPLEQAERFVFMPSPLVVIRLMPMDPGEHHRHPYGTVDVAWRLEPRVRGAADD